MAKFIDTLPGSIFGKRLLILHKSADGDVFNDIVRCPYCGEPVSFGDTRMVSGIVYCPKCQDKCIAEVLHDKERDKGRYENHDYQPYGIAAEEIER